MCIMHQKRHVWVKVFSIILFGLSLSLLVMSEILQNADILPVSIAILLLANVADSLLGSEKNVLFAIFQMTFFLFLIGGPLVSSLSGEVFYTEFSRSIIHKTLICYWIAVFAMWIYWFVASSKKENKYEAHEDKEYPLEKIRKISKCIFYMAAAAYALVTIEKIAFRSVHTLGAYYAEYSSVMPMPIVKLGDCYLIALMLYLGTKPSKEKAIKPMAVFAGISVLTLLYGVRNVAILNLAFLIIYGLLRNSDEEVWLTKKILIVGILLLPIAVIFLQAFDKLRREAGFDINQVMDYFSMDLIKEFLVSQSASAKILANAIEHDAFLEGNPVPYSFGTIHTYLGQNMITRFFTGAASYSSNSIESALHSANLGSRLAYRLYPVSYLNGVGMGNCYVAELFVDFSYVGVFLGTLFICKVIRLFTRMIHSKSPYKLAFVFVGIRWLLYVPRDSLFDWLIQSFSFMNLLFVLLVIILCRVRINVIRPNKLSIARK